MYSPDYEKPKSVPRIVAAYRASQRVGFQVLGALLFYILAVVVFTPGPGHMASRTWILLMLPAALIPLIYAIRGRYRALAWVLLLLSWAQVWMSLWNALGIGRWIKK